MKAMLIIFITIFSSLIVYGRVDQKELSDAQKFSLKSGILIQKEFVNVGTLKKANIQVVHYTDLISSKMMSAVRIEYEVKKEYSESTKIASLDPDEIRNLISSIKIIQKKIEISRPKHYVEITYRSRGGFEAGCFWSKQSKSWSLYLKLEKYDSDSYIFLKKKDIQNMLLLLNKAEKMLQ